MTISPEEIALEILQQAEDTDFLMSMARDRAACGNFPLPETPGVYLFWFEDEAEIQEAQAETYPDEAEQRLQYAAVLREAAGRLRDLGYEPSLPEKEEPFPEPSTQTIQPAIPHSLFQQVAFGFLTKGG